MVSIIALVHMDAFKRRLLASATTRWGPKRALQGDAVLRETLHPSTGFPTFPSRRVLTKEQGLPRPFEPIQLVQRREVETMPAFPELCYELAIVDRDLTEG